MKSYENRSAGHTTTPQYRYDGLYQLTGVEGSSTSHPNGVGGHTEYRAKYRQAYRFNKIGNMTEKAGAAEVNNTRQPGADRNASK
ncbi:MAG: hypothetical protein LBP60_06285 [Spirochaetaceae bacterium]|nr:hypothetical protein [Spirochaetaceae bacterium]